MKNRPKAGSKSDAVLTTIEALQARGIGIVTRAQVYAECKDDTVDYEDVSIAFIYLEKQGFLKAKGSIASTSRSGPRMVASYELTQEMEPA